MSFEKFEPARAEELQSPEKNQSVDGAQVGWKNEVSDTADKKWEDREPKKITPSIEDTALQQREWGRKITEAVKQNPDWPPAKWNPESETKIASDLENSLNTVI